VNLLIVMMVMVMEPFSSRGIRQFKKASRISRRHGDHPANAEAVGKHTDLVCR
jgi:hypothetical protein